MVKPTTPKNHFASNVVISPNVSIFSTSKATIRCRFHMMKFFWQQSERHSRDHPWRCTAFHQNKSSFSGCSSDFQWDFNTENKLAISLFTHAWHEHFPNFQWWALQHETGHYHAWIPSYSGMKNYSFTNKVRGVP